MSGLAALISATLAAMSVKASGLPAHRQVLPGILCVRGWGSKRCHFIVFVRRLPNRMANGLAASFQITGGIFQFFSLLRKARKRNFLAACSLGKWPRFLTILRSCICRLSIALVV